MLASDRCRCRSQTFGSTGQLCSCSIDGREDELVRGSGNQLVMRWRLRLIP